MEQQLQLERERLEKMTQRVQDANRQDLEAKKILAQLEAAKVGLVWGTFELLDWWINVIFICYQNITVDTHFHRYCSARPLSTVK